MIELNEDSRVHAVMFFAPPDQAECDSLFVIYRPAPEEPREVRFRFRSGDSKTWYRFLEPPGSPPLERSLGMVSNLIGEFYGQAAVESIDIHVCDYDMHQFMVWMSKQPWARVTPLVPGGEA